MMMCQDNKLPCDWNGANSAFCIWLNPKTRLARVSPPPLYLVVMLGFASFPMPQTKGVVLINLPFQIALVSKPGKCPFVSTVLQNIQKKIWPPVTRHERSYPHLLLLHLCKSIYFEREFYPGSHSNNESLAIELPCSLSSQIFTNR